MAGLRDMLTAMIVGALFLSLTFTYYYSFYQQNGLNVTGQSNITASLQYIQTNTTAQIGGIVNTTNSTLNTNNPASIGLIGNIMVFGGAIISVFGMFGALPSEYAALQTAITYNQDFIALILAAIGVTVGAVISIQIVFEVLSYIGKYRT